MTISEMLDQLAEFHSQRDALSFERSDLEARIEADRKQLIFNLIPPKIAKTIAKIESDVVEQKEALILEFAGRSETVDNNISRLEEEIRQAVLTSGKTVKGAHFMAVWNKGRTGGWDNDRLMGYAMVHPEIMGAKKPDGEPTVSIRVVGKGDTR